ncbi:MAG: formylglycine-generating enzyme family protein, partial [Myxococcota bacterium]
GEADRVRRVLDILRTRNLLIPVRLDGDRRGWELTHDSLVPRVLSWVDRRELGRRRAKEIVRYHLRRSEPSAPSLLSRRELSEASRHPLILPELDAEATAAIGAEHAGSRLLPSELVARSQRFHRHRAWLGRGAIAVAVIAAVLLGWQLDRWRGIQDRDLGRFALDIAAFDWDVGALRAAPVDIRELPELDWALYEPDSDDPETPGLPVAERFVERTGQRGPDAPADIRSEIVEVRGGTAFLRVTGRARPGARPCPPSWIRLASLPGYVARDRLPLTRVAVVVPTCQVTWADMVEIPAGTFIRGGPGEPATAATRVHANDDPRRDEYLDTFWLDRTEVTNAAYRVYDRMATWTRRPWPSYPKTEQIKDGGTDSRPVAAIDWYAARDYCRFLGKDLPSSAQWEKAVRGGKDGNPWPQRNLPWVEDMRPVPANLHYSNDDGFLGTAPVGTFAPLGREPYGLVDVIGNVQEWTRDASSLDPQFKILRGGGWFTSTEKDKHTIAFKNKADERTRLYDIGVRCMLAPGDENA